MNHRVVVTGLGTISPLGISTSSSWQNLLNGLSGIRNILSIPEWNHLHPEIRKLSSHLAAPVMEYPPSQGSLSQRTKFPRHFLFAEMAAAEALKDSNLPESFFENTGVFFGCGMPGLSEIYEHSKSTSKMSPYFIPAILGNSSAGHISRKFKLKGPLSSPSVACATGSYAIGEAYRLLRSAELGCDAILTGGCEAPLNIPSFEGFSRLRALSTSNSTPSTASRPFDLNRDGFVLGEGAGCLLLERLDSVVKRRAVHQIYAEIIGFGTSSDAYHPTLPDPSNSGAIKAINSALNASISHNLISVNAHATSTQLGDETELSALEKCLQTFENISVSSNKGAMGHLLGASGAVESVFTVLSLKHNIIPANKNLRNKIPTSLNLPTANIIIPPSFQDFSILKTSFGFGGINVALVFKKYSE